jgi:hypothetical protein
MKGAVSGMNNNLKMMNASRSDIPDMAVKFLFKTRLSGSGCKLGSSGLGQDSLACPDERGCQPLGSVRGWNFEQCCMCASGREYSMECFSLINWSVLWPIMHARNVVAPLDLVLPVVQSWAHI